MPDSAVAASQRLMFLDDTRIETLSFVTDLMAKRGFEDARKATAFVPFYKANATEDDRNTYGSIMINAASAARTAEARDAQVELAQAVVDVGATNTTLTSYAGFFILEPMVPRFQALSQAIRANRSCTEAREYQELLGKFMPAARLGSASTEPQIQAFSSTMLGYEAGETQAAAQAVSQYCR
jgi:hypothetical protein